MSKYTIGYSSKKLLLMGGFLRLRWGWGMERENFSNRDPGRHSPPGHHDFTFSGGDHFLQPSQTYKKCGTIVLSRLLLSSYNVRQDCLVFWQDTYDAYVHATDRGNETKSLHRACHWVEEWQFDFDRKYENPHRKWKKTWRKDQAYATDCPQEASSCFQIYFETWSSYTNA